MNGADKHKRSLPLMLITLLALAAFIAWRMGSVHGGARENDPAGAMLQTGSQITVRQDAYACNTPEALGRSVAYKLAGAEDKLHVLVTQHACVMITPGQRLKVVELKDKLARMESAAHPSPLWMATRDLVLADRS